jgi:ABC-type bacteriocin/lantibiotic exporter with double-glycine peptidase domain
MRGQSHRNFCGPACAANILRAFGTDRNATEDTVAKKIRQVAIRNNDEDPSNGTTESQLRRAFEAYKHPTEQWQLHTPHAAVMALRGALLGGLLGVLCVDNNTHWVAAIGVAGTRFVIADPADPEIVLIVTGEELAQRWQLTADPPAFYALIVHPRKWGRPKGK